MSHNSLNTGQGMIESHLLGHGQSYRLHLLNNWQLTRIALKSAFYTLGHGLWPGISGWRASELHNELWNRGRRLSLEDLNHRLNGGHYSNKAAALKDYLEYRDLYSETVMIEPFKATIEAYYSRR